jgi:predicted alpha/beta-fold hydrolase
VYGTHAPPALKAVAAVSPIVEIGRCVRALERPSNRLYQWNFVKDLKRRMRRKNRARPGRFDLERLATVRTVREFDETYTAPHFGFRSAEDYYYRASSLRIIDRVAVPTLVITAKDDPFVPSESFEDPKLTENPYIDLRLSEHGGHCGFVGPSAYADDGYWAEKQIVDFAERWTANPATAHVVARAAGVAG